MSKLTLLLFSSALLFGQGPTLLVLQKGHSSLGFYTPTGQQLAVVPVGPHPHEMVLSADGRLLYCTDNGTMLLEQPGEGNNTVSIVDVAARKKVGEISLGNYRRPHGIDLDRATGKLYVTTELPDQLLAIDTATRKILRTYDTKGKTSHIVKLGKGGKVAYVSNSSSSNIAAIDLVTGATTLIPTGVHPEGSVVSSDGTRLYTANREGASITIIDTQKNAPIGEIKSGKGTNRITITPDGSQLVYSAMQEHRVEIADLASRRVIGQIALEGEPVSLNLSPDGKLAYASVQDKDTVYVISLSDRKIVRRFQTLPGAGPDPVMEMSAPTRR